MSFRTAIVGIVRRLRRIYKALESGFPSILYLLSSILYPRLRLCRAVGRAVPIGFWASSLFILLLSSADCLTQPAAELRPPPPLEPAEGERQARALLKNLLSQSPVQGSTNNGVLKIRSSGDSQRDVPVRFEVIPGPTNWLNSYETQGPTNSPRFKLTVVHLDGQSNQYRLETVSSSDSSREQLQILTGNALMVPFAGSDFWIADLGLEFLHWPEQRVLKKQMRKGLSCDVLQSMNPQPGPGPYARVLSWIAVNRPDDIVIVHAEAYDSRDKLLKEFDPKKVEKVDGVWQLEEMEIRNRQTGSRTKIEFNF